MINTSGHVDTPDGLMSDTEEVESPSFDFETQESVESEDISSDEIPITDKIEEFYSNSISDTQEVGNYDDISQDINMESSIDLDKYLEEFDKVDEADEADDIEEVSSSTKETDEERLKRIREKRKRKDKKIY